MTSDNAASGSAAPGPGRGGPPGAGSPARDDQPALPLRSTDESDTGWGDPPEPDDEERLRADRPPHWDGS
ncbi:MAG TPA: hypothetical protein VGG35_11890 [Streptosporangiaceae bacterium]